MPRYRGAEDFLGHFAFGGADAQIMSFLKQMAEQIVADAQNNVHTNKTYKGNNLPGEIADAISAGEVKKTDNGRFVVEIKVDLNEAPMARAYELGSGERATRGKAEDYPIVAKNAPALAFLWEYPSPLGRKYIVPEDEFVRFTSIMHPGVEAVPYLKPAVDKNRKEFASKFNGMLREVIRKTTVKRIYIEPETE